MFLLNITHNAFHQDIYFLVDYGYFNFWLNYLENFADESIGCQRIWESIKNVLECGKNHFIENGKNHFLSKFKELNGFEKFENYFEKNRDICSKQEINLIDLKKIYETSNSTHANGNYQAYENLYKIQDWMLLEKIWGGMQWFHDRFSQCLQDEKFKDYFFYKVHYSGGMEKFENSYIKTKEFYIKKERKIQEELLFWKCQS